MNEILFLVILAWDSKKLKKGREDEQKKRRNMGEVNMELDLLNWKMLINKNLTKWNIKNLMEQF